MAGNTASTVSDADVFKSTQSDSLFWFLYLWIIPLLKTGIHQTCISQIPHGAAGKKQPEKESSALIQRFSGPSKRSRHYDTNQ